MATTTSIHVTGLRKIAAFFGSLTNQNYWTWSSLVAGLAKKWVLLKNPDPLGFIGFYQVLLGFFGFFQGFFSNIGFFLGFFRVFSESWYFIIKCYYDEPEVIFPIFVTVLGILLSVKINSLIFISLTSRNLIKLTST